MFSNFFSNPEAYLGGFSLVAVLAAYLGGILASFTPCVYPVIPITVAYIGASGESSGGRGFLLSSVYVFGMAATYTTLGAFAALTGQLFGLIQSNPWVSFLIGNIFIFMGLSMLGLFMMFPTGSGFLARFQLRVQKKSMMGAFFVGILSGFIMGPCTTPVLAVLLSFIATGNSVIYGMVLMFLFALGMGTLLIVLGTFARLLIRIPRSGTWMMAINKVFGIVLMGVGEYFLIKAGMLWI